MNVILNRKHIQLTEEELEEISFEKRSACRDWLVQEGMDDFFQYERDQRDGEGKEPLGIP